MTAIRERMDTALLAQLSEGEPRSWWKEAVLAATFAAAVALRYAADPVLGPRHAFTAAFAAVALATWYGTWRAGLLCALLSFGACEYLFVEPRHKIQLLSPSKGTEALFYWTVAGLVLFISHRAIESRRAAERLIARLQAADARKSELLATIAHELKNPLAAVTSAVDLLQSDQTDPSTRTMAVAVLFRQVAFMNRLTDDLMDSARIQQGKIQLKLSQVAAADLLKAALESAEPALRQRNQRCEVSVADDVPPLLVDPTRMYQVLSNLLSNASRYSPACSDIRVEAKRLQDGVAISVADSGTGIPPEKLEWVFDTFTQLTEGGQGLGLGLSLVRRLIELHGGSITARSRGQGDGTTFEIVLPASAITTECRATPRGER